MATGQDALWERFLAPIFSHFLIDREAIQHDRHTLDWQAECDRLSQPNLIYPDYYRNANFHGVKGGYLTPDAAVTYDPITQYVLPPSEAWVRQGLIDRIPSPPRRILDLGCGTGSMTLMLKQTYPEAEVVGIDLSPQMLVMAERKAQAAGQSIQFRHGNAEHTGLPDASFDLVTAALLFHETPPSVSQAILRESLRLLTCGGSMLVLDGCQSTLRYTEWLMDIFEEPYIRDYAVGSVDAWMGQAGFGQVRTDIHWGIHQVTRGVKPLPYATPDQMEAVMNRGDRPIWVTG